ncbi:hypothetical protein [Falsibacillus albus]|nr:hypothetical protein [Falsibacillus albus]
MKSYRLDGVTKETGSYKNYSLQSWVKLSKMVQAARLSRERGLPAA